MHVVVLGAGAVGGYFGGKLAVAGYPITFLVREKRYEQLKNEGLQVQSIHGDFIIHPNLVTQANAIEKPDLVLLAVKNYQLDGTMNQLEVLVSNGAKILPLLNGIAHLDTLIDRFGEENVLGGACYIESTLDKKGRVIQTSSLQDITFGSFYTEQPELMDEFETMLRAAGINGSKSEQIMEVMWQKYIFLASLSGITSALRKPIGVAMSDEVTYNFARELVSEVYHISDSLMVKLPETTIQDVMDQMSNISSDMTSSMHRDLEKGLPIELESLHGALVDIAQEMNLEAPCLRAIYALLHPFSQGVMPKVNSLN